MFLWNILNGYFQAVAPRWQDATASYPTVLTKSVGYKIKKCRILSYSIKVGRRGKPVSTSERSRNFAELLK
jgi:hypothetical protein